MTSKNRNLRCRGQTKSGKPCRAAATAGGLCFFHANPNKAAELGRIGGSKSRLRPAVTDPLPKLDKVSAVRDVVEKLIAEIYAGKLHPRVAAGLAPLLNLQMRAIEATDIELRVSKLERWIATKNERSDPVVHGRPGNG